MMTKRSRFCDGSVAPVGRPSGALWHGLASAAAHPAARRSEHRV